MPTATKLILNTEYERIECSSFIYELRDPHRSHMLLREPNSQSNAYAVSASYDFIVKRLSTKHPLLYNFSQKPSHITHNVDHKIIISKKNR